MRSRSNDEGAAAAVDLEAVVVLAAGREAAALDAADRAVLEAQRGRARRRRRRRGRVPLPSSSGRSGTKVSSRPLTSAISPTRWRARSSEWEPMSPRAPEPARFAFSRRQTRGKLGIHDPVLEVGAAVVVDAPEAPRVEEALRERHRGGATVVVAEHVDDAGLRGPRDSIWTRLRRPSLARGFSQRIALPASAAGERRPGEVGIARRADVHRRRRRPRATRVAR